MNDAAILGRAFAQLIGSCRICRCKGDHCRLPDGDRCVWIDEFRTLCSSPECISAAVRQQKKFRNQQRAADRRAKNAPPSWMSLAKKAAKKTQRKAKSRAKARAR